MPASKKSWCVYIVECSDGTLYCGTTNHLAARLAAHDEGRGARYTRGRGPVRLVFKRRAGSRSAALRQELGIKAMTRAAKLKLVASWRGADRF